MSTGDYIRILMIVVGVVLLLRALSSLSRRRMIESYTILWCIVSLVLIVAGVLISPNQINYYFSNTSIIAISVIAIVGLVGMYGMTSQISNLTRQNREQSMDMAVMGYTIECLAREIEDFEAKEDTVSE